MKYDTAAAFAAPASPEVFHRLGTITRQLHDTLQKLGVWPKLQQAADGLPDARSRLSYISLKTGEAADKVLALVDAAKAEQAGIAEQASELIRSLGEPAQPVAADAVSRFVAEVQARAQRTDRHLTEIMLAQDFHDLTGQVVAKVVRLAIDLEDGLLKLLLEAAPAERLAPAEPAALDGPVVDPRGRTDVVRTQSEVDDLLASLGF